MRQWGVPLMIARASAMTVVGAVTVMERVARTSPSAVEPASHVDGAAQPQLHAARIADPLDEAAQVGGRGLAQPHARQRAGLGLQPASGQVGHGGPLPLRKERA